MSSPVDRAKQDLERLDAQIRKIQDERAQVVAFITMYQRYAEDEPKPKRESLGQLLGSPRGA